MKRSLAALAFLPLACASAVETSKLEDKARRSMPVPVCVQPLKRSTSGVSSVVPEDYWKMVLPAFDSSSATIDTGAPDCTGRPAFSESELLNAEGPRTGQIPAKPENLVVAPGPDQLRVVWLRTYKFADDSWSGPLALTRAKDGYAEVYGTGTYRGKPTSTRFSLERMGSRMLVTATDEGCGQNKPGQACETSYNVYLLTGGRLAKAASFALDRVDYRPFGGLPGLAKYRLTAAPVFQAKAMRVVEQVTVEDSNQGTVRKSDLERVFRLEPDGSFKPSGPSLWTEVEATSNRPPPAPPPAPTAPPPGKQPPKPR